MRLALVTQIKPLALPWASTDYNTNFHIDVISMCKELKLQFVQLSAKLQRVVSSCTSCVGALSYHFIIAETPPTTL